MEKSNRIQGLDLLRFIAAIGVLFYHFFFSGPLEGYWDMSLFEPIALWGEFGVDVFFILSGVVILMSTRERKAGQFIWARIIRIYPAFIVCSIFTAVLACFLPGTELLDIFRRWLASLTLMPDLFGVQPLTNVYWTLMVEVKFYIIVALVIKCDIWEDYKYTLLGTWLVIALLNTFYIQDSVVANLFITKYAGHFCSGILCYLMLNGEKNKFMPLGFILSCILINESSTGIISWLNSLHELKTSSIVTFLIGPVAIGIVYWMCGVKELPISKKVISILGATSYTLYLTHADLAFFIRTSVYGFLIPRFPESIYWMDDKIIVIFVICISIILAVVLAICIEPKMRTIIEKIKVKVMCGKYLKDKAEIGCN